MLTEDARAWLRGHDWPGNIRELRNACERAVLLATGSMIERQHLTIDEPTRLPGRFRSETIPPSSMTPSPGTMAAADMPSQVRATGRSSPSRRSRWSRGPCVRYPEPMRSSDRRKSDQGPDQAHAASAAPGRSRRQPGALPAKAKSPHVVGHAASVPRHQLGAVNGGAQNVDLTQINNHPGFDHNRLGHDHGKPFKTTQATQMYQDDGEPIPGAEIPAHHAVYINAGAITQLILKTAGRPNSKPVWCVYIFNWVWISS